MSAIAKINQNSNVTIDKICNKIKTQNPNILFLSSKLSKIISYITINKNAEKLKNTKFLNNFKKSLDSHYNSLNNVSSNRTEPNRYRWVKYQKNTKDTNNYYNLKVYQKAFKKLISKNNSLSKRHNNMMTRYKNVHNDNGIKGSKIDIKQLKTVTNDYKNLINKLNETHLLKKRIRSKKLFKK